MVLTTGKYVQNVKDKINKPECVSNRKSTHTVQEDTDNSDDWSDTFFITMVSHDTHGQQK